MIDRYENRLSCRRVQVCRVPALCQYVANSMGLDHLLHLDPDTSMPMLDCTTGYGVHRITIVF